MTINSSILKAFRTTAHDLGTDGQSQPRKHVDRRELIHTSLMIISAWSLSAIIFLCFPYAELSRPLRQHISDYFLPGLLRLKPYSSISTFPKNILQNMAETHHLKASKLFSMEGKVAVVTGGGSGIGLMTAQALSANGTVSLLEREEVKTDSNTRRKSLYHWQK